VVAWGRNYYGECNVPTALGPFDGIAAGQLVSMAIRRLDGSVAVWGAEATGLLASPAGLSGVEKIAVGGGFACAVTNAGAIRAWGWNYYGTCNVPPNIGPVSDVAAGYSHVLALRTDGSVVAWGNSNGGATNIPVIAAERIAATELTSLALLPDPVVCTGDLNGDGTVNGQDLGFVLGAWGAGAATPADLNQDGVVNGIDLGVLLGAWGACP
jgi:alpha-tubulin suppressor-like RCC1 family protein